MSVYYYLVQVKMKKANIEDAKFLSEYDLSVSADIMNFIIVVVIQWIHIICVLLLILMPSSIFSLAIKTLFE